MAQRRRNNEGEFDREREDFAAESGGTLNDLERNRDFGRESMGRETYGRESMREFERGRDFGRGRELGSYGRESYGPSGMTGRESNYETGSGFGSGSMGGGGYATTHDRWSGGARYGGPQNPPSRFDRESFGGGYGPTTGIYGAEPGAWRVEEGPFRGRGPRGYQRSDERIHEDVCERLTQHGRVDASNIDVRVENGEVTLVGTVDDRQMKRLAEDLAENVSGVKQVHNQIRIGAASQQSEGKARPATRPRK